jgi:hypothetical protein
MNNIFGETEEQRAQSLGLLGLLTGGGILAGNQPGASMGQALGQGLNQGVSGLMQMQGQRSNQELRALQMQKLKQDMAREQGRQSAQAALFGGQDGSGVTWNTPRPMDDAQRESMMAQAYPDEYAKAKLTEMFPKSVATLPAAPIQNFAQRQALVKQYGEDSGEVRTFDNYVRSLPFVNAGPAFVQPGIAGAGTTPQVIPRGLNPGEEPEVRGRQAEASAAGTTTGRATAEATMDLPTTIAQAEQSLQLIDQLLNHPGLGDVVGMPGSISGAVNTVTGRAIPGTDAADFKALLDQIGGQQFLQAFESLKGGGAITQIEGDKATRAISRLTQTGQSEAAYKKAAQEFKDVIQAGINRAKMKAGSRAISPAPAPAQSSGASGSWSIQKVD